MARPPRKRDHYHVYVVELADQVWNSARFRAANPRWQPGKPFVYVGMTGLDPDLRFDRHKAGIKANAYVRDHGLRLLPQLYERYNRRFQPVNATWFVNMLLKGPHDKKQLSPDHRRA